MKGRQLVAGVNPAERAARLFVFLGMALVGFVIGTGEPVVAERTFASLTHRPGAIGLPTLLMVLAALLIAAALVLARRVHHAGAEGLLRDPATGLYRPDYVAEAVSQLIADDDREGRSRLALVVIEIDFLGDIRRRYGGAAAGELLACVGRHVRGQSREADLPMCDADGFMVWLRCEELEQADAFSRRLAMLLAAEQFELQGDVVKVSVSMGAAVRATGETLDAVQRRATLSLGEAQEDRSAA